MKAEGQKKGYPDMSLDKACGIYHGMRIELKEPNGKAPTKEQIALDAQAERGRLLRRSCVWCRTSDNRHPEYISLKKG